MLYRIRQRLLVDSTNGTFIEPWDEDGLPVVASLEGIGKDKIAVLVKVGAVSPVRPPPLESLPGWKLRAERLEETGIDVLEFLQCEPTDIVRRVLERTGIQWREGFVQTWQDELMGYLGIGGVARPKTG